MPKRSLQTTVLDGNFENISTCHHDIIRKSSSSSDSEDTIPVSIQIFLWRQSNPFLKQKFGNLTEASAIIFDQVLVQNILHGLSPSLTDAISSIPRWLLVKAAFPHVIHACSSVIQHNLCSIQQQQQHQQQSFSPTRSSLLVASSPSHSSIFSNQLQVPPNHQLSISLHPTIHSTEYQLNQSYLSNRLSLITNQLLNSTEIRLFHTLHYLILHSNETTDQLLSLNIIQLFIYLFIPYIHTYIHNNEKQFLSNSELSQGMHLIWQPLFEYHQPNIHLFNAFIKPMILKNNQQEQKFSIDNNNQHRRLSTLIQSSIQRSLSEKQYSSNLTKQLLINPPIKYHKTRNTSCFQSEIKIEEKQKLNISSILTDSNPTTATTTYNSITDLLVDEITNNNRQKRAPLVNMTSICSMSDLSRLTSTPQSPVANISKTISGMPTSISTPSIPLHFLSSQQLPNISHNYSTDIGSSSKAHTSEFLLLATYFDIGIIRTLFSSSWLTDGYLWCLEYLHKRMINISDEILSNALTTGILPIHILRFNSLSMPQINTLNKYNYYKYLENNYFNEQITHNIIEQQCMTTTISNSIKQSTKLLNIPFQYFSEKFSFNKKDNQKDNNNFYKKIREKQLLTRNKIRYIDEDTIEHLDLASTDRLNSFHVSSSSSSQSSRFHLTDPTLLLFKTSISNNTDTIHQSINSDNSIRKISPTITITNLNTMKTYSISDSEINYKFLEEIEEVNGSNGYINRNGTINFGIILAGIHAVICKENDLKVCELVMNILDVLFGLTVISSAEDEINKKQLSINENNHMTTTDERTNGHIEKWLKQIHAIEDEKFQLALDIILRILKRLGCSNCQTGSRNFVMDQLRGKARLLLNKLRLLHQHRFEKYFLNFVVNADLVQILDILHALCGYCVESNIGLAHYAPYIPIKPDIPSRQTYSNNFGNTHLGIGSKCVDGFILNIIFKPLVIRLNKMEEYLLTSENIVLYSECRAFLIYIKENHGGIFRSAVFSSLIDPEKKLRILRQKIKDKFIQQNDSRIKIFLHRDSSDDINESIDQQLHIQSTKEEQSPIHSKLKSTQLLSGSLTGDDDHSSYEHQEENLYVDLTLVRMGLLRLNCLLESCPPGSLPDPQFLDSLLFLDAPIISKAAFLIECAYYVRCCSLGQWPIWMRKNIITFRPHDTSTGRINGSINLKLNKIYQAAAARMFYIWGDALSSQLESILDLEEQQQQQQNSTTNLWNKDEIFEDYYNEAIVNPSGRDCPYTLKLIICLLLYEITSFLRETYETLPKLSTLRTEDVNYRQQRTTNSQNIIDTSSIIIDKHLSDRPRKDSVVSQTSNRSTLSLSSEQQSFSPSMLSKTIINMNPSTHERHISFATKKEYDSNESYHTTVIINDDNSVGVLDRCSTSVSSATNKRKSIAVCTMKSKLHRRSSTKLTKLPMRMKDTGKTTHRSSYRARRRSHISNISNDTDFHQNNIEYSTMEPTNEYPTCADDEYDLEKFDNIINTQPFPWIKVIIRIFNNVNLTCDHQIKCLSNCYEKQTKSCKNLLNALLNMYQLSSLSSHSSSSIQTNLKSNNTIPNKTRQFSTCLFGKQTTNLHMKKEINTHFNSISTYLKKQVGSLMQIPLMILCKSSVLLDDKHYSQILPLSWELLLDRNEELSSCAATIVILTAARANHLVEKLIHTEMENSSALIRYNAILKFQILWRFRHQFWIRLEDGAHSMMKILPPSIEFVLPSPTLGVANLQTVDPPWMPYVKTLVQQVALNQEEVRAVVTTSKTRKKHQQELIHSALMTEEISKRVARENFSMSIVSMLQAASFEPLLHQSRDDEEEAHIDDDRIVDTSIQLCQAQGTFPSIFGAAIFHLVEMLEDEEIITNGATISDAARKVLWTCLLDEPTLLIRFFFEKISHKERRIKSFQCLHRLMIYFTDIPPQFAHAIFNYVLGLLLNMVRSPLDGSQELIVNGLTLLWQIIPYLHGLVLKDLKQILRKEQAEMLILVSGNIPSTKKVIIHGPDVSQIPTQAIISEDTQFSNVLQEALEFFGISNLKRDQYYLIDIKTKQIHISDTYVRDFYFFRRNIHPQLSLVYMDIKQSKRELEQMSIFLKTTELSKVLFARYLLENTPFNQIHNCITFFHDELIKSPLFPRKPLESDFNLYTIIHNKELFHLDMLHKYNWTKLIACIFFNMDGKTSTTSDITLFLSVINGSFILHCEDLVMLRFCLATYINIVKHFRHIFATNGYLLIMPTFLHVYSNIQSNPMLKKAIEYCCRQFYILHRIPFILQMLGSISQLFNFDQSINVTDTNKIQSIYLFRLLIALEQTNIDIMNDDYFILELVKNNSLITNRTINIPIGNMSVVAALGQGIMIPPTIIKSLDFCYADDDTIFTFLNCLDVCVTVVAYAPDSIRSLQMLNIIHILLPKYFEYIKDYTNKNDIQKNGRDEIKIIEKLSITIKTLISTTEWLTRTFIEPKCDTSLDGIYKYSRGSYRSASIAIDDDSVNRFIDDRTKSKTQDTDQLKQVSEFRWPRDIFLSIISIFIYFSSQRLNELIKLLHDSTIRIPELLDAKSHIRLADIVHTLLKLASFDPIITCCHGLQNYFQKLLPYTNWSDEQLRSALNHLLRRIDRMFIKICKKQMTKHCFDWEATAGILNGIYLTIDRHPYIAYFPNLKALISGCIALILNENQVDSNHSIPRLNTLIFPKEFSYSVIKLVGRYLLAINHQPNLEALTTNNSWSSVNPSLTLNYLLHFLLPLLLWMSSEQKNVQKIHSNDISYIITILLNSVKSNLKLATTMGTQNLSLGHLNNTGKQYLTSGETILPNINFTHKSMKQLKYLSRTASLLGLKIFIISFSKQIKYEWQRIIRAIKLMCNKQSNISSNILLFIDFIVSYKTPIYVILRPFLLHYIHSITSENDCDYEIIRNIQQKLMFDKIVPLKSMNEILNELIQELNQLKAELTDESRASDVYDTRPTSTEKIRLDSETHQQMKDSDGITTRMNTMQDGRLNNSLTTNTFNYQQQQQLCDNSLNLSSKKRPEKIRPNEALNILETYYARYRIRCGGDHVSQNCTEHLTVNCLSSMTNETTTFMSDTSRLRSPSNSHSPMSLLRAVTVTGNRSPTTIDHSFQYYNPMKESFSDKFSIDKEITPQLRTFRGWKRNLAHLDKSRSTKSSGQLSTSKVSTMKYDSTKEMNPIFRPIRQVNEQHSIPVINERSSNSLHVHASHNQTILNSFFDDNINPGDDQASNSCIPLTETVLRQSESDKNALVSRLSNTSPMNVDDEDESQL